MSRIGPRIEVPRLSEAARQRMRSQVFERLERGAREAPLEAAGPAASGGVRGWRITALVSAGALCLAVIALLATGVLRSRGQDARGAGSSLSRLVTAGAPSHATVGDAELDLAAHSSLTVTGSPDGGVHLVLEQGRVHCTVAPRGSRPPFVVSAADVRVEVVGTRFEVSRSGDAVAVAVDKGVVRVVRGGQVTLVAAGHRWPPVQGQGAGAGTGSVSSARAGGGGSGSASASAGAGGDRAIDHDPAGDVSVNMKPLVLDRDHGRARVRSAASGRHGDHRTRDQQDPDGAASPAAGVADDADLAHLAARPRPRRRRRPVALRARRAARIDPSGRCAGPLPPAGRRCGPLGRDRALRRGAPRARPRSPRVGPAPARVLPRALPERNQRPGRAQAPGRPAVTRGG